MPGNDLDPSTPVISSISPTHGPNGTIVTITGTGFNTITVDSILFIGKKGTILSHNDTSGKAYIGLCFPFRLIQNDWS